MHPLPEGAYFFIMIKRVILTSKAEELIQDLKSRFGELMFHQSGGCCDGSQPMCFEKGDFKVGSSDVLLGSIADCDFYMSRDQFEYWQYCQLEIDIVKGRGSSFSLEIPSGYRFVVRSRLFEQDELEQLEPLGFID